MFYIIFFIFNVCYNSPNDRSIDFLLEAETFLLLDEYNLAEEQYIQALNYSPNNTVILLALAEINLIQGKINSAERYIHKAYVIDKDDINVITKYYQILLDRDRKHEALKILNKAITFKPDDLNLYYDKVKILFEIEDWENLIILFYEIYKITNNNILLDQMTEIAYATDKIDILISLLNEELMIIHNKDDILKRLIKVTYQHDQAICKKYLLTFVYNHPDNLYFNIILAEIYFNQNEHNLSISILKQIKNQNLASLDILKLLLLNYRKLNLIDKQIEISKEIISLYPNNEFGYESIILIYIRQNRMQDALDAIANSQNRFPDNYSFNYYLGLIYDIKQKPFSAREYYNKALQMNSKAKEVIFSLAMNYENENELVISDSLFNKFIKMDPTASDKNDYAYIVSQRDDISNEKLKYLLKLSQETIEYNPESPEYLDTIGYIYFRLGNINKSIYFLELSLRDDGENIIILSHLLDAYYKLNNFNKASEIYYKINSINSNFLNNNNKRYNLMNYGK